MSPEPSDGADFPHGTILLLGLVTIVAYGAWYYAFGVLLDPILTDTGWPESGLTATYSLSTALGALSSVPAGHLVDRRGSRAAFAAAAVLAGSGFAVATSATSFVGFAAGAIVGGAALQGLAFYHVTQAVAARSAPGRSARAIATLTIYGAFSSPVYLPLAAALVGAMGWRPTLRILVAVTVVVLAAAAVVGPSAPATGQRRAGLDLGSVWGNSAARTFVVATGLVGLGLGTMLVYQVPLMIGAGLPVGAAAWMAGARGAAQITGRIPLAWIVGRLGARRSVRLAFAVVTVSMALLAIAGNLALALVWVAVAGFGIGAMSPLQGIYGAELFDEASLGASMGVVTMVFGLSSAAGPALVGVLADATGTRSYGLVLAVVAGAIATLLVGIAPPTRAPDPG